MRHGWLSRIVGIVLVFPFVLSAVADEPAGEDGLAGGDRDLARLEALLEAQQWQLEDQRAQIDALGYQLAAAAGQQEDAGRVEVMKQQIREVLSEQEFRESLMPAMVQAGYDEGFYIRSTDDRFSMTVNGLLQFRFTHYGTRSTNRYLAPGFRRSDRTGFDMNRTRLRFSGHAYSQDLTWAIELQADAGDGYGFIIGDAFVNYRFADAFNFQAGYFRIASTRAQMTDDSVMQFPARPLADVVFGFGYGIGVRFWGQFCDSRLEYYVDVMNSLGDNNGSGFGRTITPDPRELDNNPAILFRAVWHAIGDDPGGDFASQADLPRHESPALDFGFHYAFNEDDGDVMTTRIPFPRRTFFREGGFGLTRTTGLQINQFGLDAAFKWMGFSATGEYIIRLVDVRAGDRPPFAPLFLLTGDDSTNAQHGAYLQMGYFLPIPGLEEKFEVVARAGGVSALASGREGTWEYSGGLNYYIEGQKVKLQTDVTKVSEVPISSNYSSFANVNDDALIWRVQLQVAF